MTEHVAYRQIRRPAADWVARARAIAVSDLYEALPPPVRDGAVMSARMRPLVLGVKATGPAITVQCAPGDNLMMHRGLLLAEPGDMLVVAGGEPSGAQWGYLAAVYAQRKGLAGVVVHGAIRDADWLAENRYPVWSTAVAPAHPEKRAPGAVNVPIVCDGVRVRPGDVVCADGDGVLVIGPEHLMAAVVQAEARVRHEAETAAAIEAGRSLFDLHGVAHAYAASGVREIDGAWEGEA